MASAHEQFFTCSKVDKKRAGTSDVRYARSAGDGHQLGLLVSRRLVDGSPIRRRLITTFGTLGICAKPHIISFSLNIAEPPFSTTFTPIRAVSTAHSAREATSITK